jgi:hypothetical protein
MDYAKEIDAAIHDKLTADPLRWMSENGMAPTDFIEFRRLIRWAAETQGQAVEDCATVAFQIGFEIAKKKFKNEATS